jgi:colanic acid/amylovoran biosynthesis glycosyltransferase
LHVAYFTNQYPKVSHTFIRREIAALERRGVTVSRFALRGWDAVVAGAEDESERKRTAYVLRRGLLPLLVAAARRLLLSPAKGFAAFGQALAMARRSDRSWPFHLVYFAEACLLADWLKACGAEFVHVHFGTNAAEVAMLARTLGAPPFSFTAHGPEEFDKPEALGLARKIGSAAFVVAISSFGRSQLSRWVPSTTWPAIQVVHCGLESDFFVPTGTLAPSRTNHLICVGRLCEQKGQLLLVEAAARLLVEGVEFQLVLAGDGEMRAEIEQSIARHGLGERIRITGWISSDQVRAELMNARALVLPSFAEGLPVVIMEAMAIGRPVISTWIAGIPELVRDGVDGWLVPAGDVDAVAGAMRSCLAASEEALAAMGRAARERVAARHHVDVEAAKLEALFGNAIGAGR